MTHLTSFCPDADTYIDSYHSSTNFANYIINWIGTKNSNTCYRTLLRFNISSIPGDALITCAKLKLYVDYAQNPKAIGKFAPYVITSPWKECKVTWDNCPSFDESFYGPTVCIGGSGWYEWDISQIIKAWHKKENSNYGILLMDNNGLISDSKRLIASKNTKSCDMPFRPVLSVYYDLHQKLSNNVQLIGRKFEDKSINVKTSNDFLPTIAFDTSQQSQVTFFIINTGHNAASVMLEAGPNDIDYVTDDKIFEILPGKVSAAIPMIFAKYTRLIYKSKEPSKDTSLKIIFQSFV